MNLLRRILAAPIIFPIMILFGLTVILMYFFSRPQIERFMDWYCEE